MLFLTCIIMQEPNMCRTLVEPCEKMVNSQIDDHVICVTPQVGELAGIAVGATVMLNILIAG